MLDPIDGRRAVAGDIIECEAGHEIARWTATPAPGMLGWSDLIEFTGPLRVDVGQMPPPCPCGAKWIRIAITDRDSNSPLALGRTEIHIRRKGWV